MNEVLQRKHIILGDDLNRHMSKERKLCHGTGGQGFGIQN